MGLIKYNSHSVYIASVINEDDWKCVRTDAAGIYRRIKNLGDAVERGDVLAEILYPYEGEVISKILSPTDGVIFFAHTSPLVMKNVVVYKIIRRIHE